VDVNVVFASGEASSVITRACCSAAEIVRFIWDKKLKWVGRLAGVDGYLAVLVDLEEIRELVRGYDHGGLMPYQVACQLETTDRVARALIKHGHLVTVSARELDQPLSGGRWRGFSVSTCRCLRWRSNRDSISGS
jgi:hypothetical protein